MRPAMRDLMAICSSVALTLTLVAGAIAARADEPQGIQKDAFIQKLSLQDALEEANSSNPRLRAMRKTGEARKSGVDAADAAGSLQLRLKETAGGTDSPTMAFMGILNQERFTPADFARINDPDSTFDLHTSFELVYPVYMGGRIRSGRAMAGAAEKMSEQEIRRAEQQVRRDVVNAWWGVVMAKANRNLLERSLETAQAHQKLAENHNEAGMAVYSDVLRADVRVLELEEAAASAGYDVKMAMDALLFQMGAPADRLADVEDAAFVESPVSYELSDLIEIASASRPDIKAMDEVVEMKRAAADMAKAERRPTASLVGTADLHGESLSDPAAGQSWFMAAMVNWSLYDGGKAGASTAAARAEMESMALSREELARAAALQVRKAWFELMSARDGIRVGERAVAQAEESLRIVRNRYEAGLSGIVELLDAETALTQAELRHLDAQRRYVSGYEELAFAVGANLDEKREVRQ